MFFIELELLVLCYVHSYVNMGWIRFLLCPNYVVSSKKNRSYKKNTNHSHIVYNTNIHSIDCEKSTIRIGINRKNQLFPIINKYQVALSPYQMYFPQLRREEKKTLKTMPTHSIETRHTEMNTVKFVYVSRIWYPVVRRKIHSQWRSNVCLGARNESCFCT